ncbi:MAG: hypothetical protein WAM73_13285, partial [Desulfobacterales bacterium]
RTGADKNFEKLPWELGLIVFGHNVPQKISVDFQRTNSGLAKTFILKPIEPARCSGHRLTAWLF